MSKEKKLVKVLLPLSLPPLTYQVAEELQVGLGDYVKVPLSGKVACGVVWQNNIALENLDPAKIKTIESKLDLPPISKNLQRFIKWVADYTLSPIGNVLKLCISVPKALNDPKPVKKFQLANHNNIKLTQLRQKVLDFMQPATNYSISEICQGAQVKSNIVKGLVIAGVIKEIEEDIEQVAEVISSDKTSLPLLSSEQQAASQQLLDNFEKNKFSVTLINGVTGSGKTEIYFTAVHKILMEDATSQVLILLPEIALTSQMLDRFEKRLGFMPMLWHSGLSDKYRVENWRAVAHGKARLVIAARSGLFLPYKNLRLIIVDEEHDSSYKQEDGVIYHGRDMAVMRAKTEEIPIVLVSATPALETMHNVDLGKYSLINLPYRYGQSTMPEASIVDMRKEKLAFGCWLSSQLKLSITHSLQKQEQVLLFLNRRGYAPLSLCQGCGYRFNCPNCSSWLVEHKRLNSLVCHHCGYSIAKPQKCPTCSAGAEKIVACGPGVERIAEEVKNLFPQARTQIMASDGNNNLEIIQAQIKAIENKEIDIIIGTQIIAKGYHFPGITLVGVIDADLGLSGGDLRAAERTFQLLQQVSGRAGRENDQGRVILQSYFPDNSVIKALVGNSGAEFLTQEKHSRKITQMPPYWRLASIIVGGANEDKVKETAREITRYNVGPKYRILGPAPAPVYMLRGKYRYRILLKGPKEENIQPLVKTMLGRVKVPSSVRVKVDIDPYSFS